MKMTVRQLRRALAKMPQDAEIAWCDHDHDWDAGEMNGPVTQCVEAPQAIRAKGFGVVLG